MIKMHGMRLLASFILLAAVGCMGAATPSARTPDPSATPLPEAPRGDEIRLTPTPSKALEQIATTEPASATGEVPEALLAAILDDLAARAGVQRDAIRVVGAEAVVWSDGSLGCPQPGMVYTLVLVKGYQVVLEVDGARYDYHANEQGYFFPCAGGAAPAAPTPSPVA